MNTILVLVMIMASGDHHYSLIGNYNDEASCVTAMDYIEMSDNTALLCIPEHIIPDTTRESTS